jgi:hypothetical protein
MLYVIDNEQARTIRSFAPGGARAGFQYVNEVSGSIEPYRAMPLLAISNTLNADGLATSAPKFWENSWLTWLDTISWRDHNCWRRQLWPWLEYLGLQRAVRWADRFAGAILFLKYLTCP